MPKQTNIFAHLPVSLDEESFTDLLHVPGLRIERIVSQGHASPPDFWYDQGWDEWVLVLQGEATLEFDDPPKQVVLRVGDYYWLPAGLRHRVASTDTNGPTIWLAVHRGENDPPHDDFTNKN